MAGCSWYRRRLLCVPLVGGLAALTTGTAALAAAGSALLAYASPFAMTMLALARMGGTVTWWTRRRRKIRTPGPDGSAEPALCQPGQLLPQ